MLRGILNLSLNFRILALALAASVLSFGALRIQQTPIEVLPEFDAPVIEVQTEALGLSAAEVEELVTLNLEELLAATPWLRSLRSKSIQGLSSILLVFEPGTDLMHARQMVHERLIMAHALPNVSKPPNMLQPVATARRAMIVGLSSSDLPLTDMSVLARWTITPKLQGVPGVANVAVWGMRSRQLQVQVDPERLRQVGVTLEKVVESTGEALWVSPLSFLEASTPGAGGWIDGPNQRLGIQHVQPITNSAELAKVVVDGTSLRLGDVAKVVEQHPPLIGDALVNNGPGLLVVIEKLPNADVRQVVGGVDAALAELQQGLPNIKIDNSIFRATSFIDASLVHLGRLALLGLVLVALVLWLSASGWRAVLTSLVTIVLALSLAWLVLYLRKTTVNAMVLAGFALALAAIIDDAIVDVRTILQRRAQVPGSGGERPGAETVLAAFLENRTSLVYAMLIAILALLPLLAAGGATGALSIPLVATYALALLASMTAAIVFMPAVAIVLLPEPSSRSSHSSDRSRKLTRFEGILSWCLGTPRMAVAIVTLCLVIGAAAVPFLRWSPLPAFKERDMTISWTAEPGTSQPEMQRILRQANGELQLVPGVRRVATHFGRAVAGDQVVGIESAQTWVSLDPGADYDAALAAVSEIAEGYPGLDVEIGTYLDSRLKEALAEPDKGIVVRVEGLSKDVLQREAEKVRQNLVDIAGLANVRLESRREVPHVEIEVDLAAAGRVGLKPGDVRRAVATVFAGLEVGLLFEQQKVFDVVVWGAPEARQSLTDLRDLQIAADNGYVRLSDIAQIRIVPGAPVLEREGVSRGLRVLADIGDRDPDAVAADVRARLQSMAFPLEYHAVLLRDYAKPRQDHRQTAIAALAAAAGIFLLLQACLRSWRLAALLGLSLMAAPVGGILAILGAGGSLTLGGLSGLLAVVGLTSRYGIPLVRRFQELESQTGQAIGPDLVLRGARDRAPLILTSAAAIGAALVPVVFVGNAAGVEMVHPIAVAMLGGLVTTVLVTLAVVPALYCVVARPLPELEESARFEHAA